MKNNNTFTHALPNSKESRAGAMACIRAIRKVTKLLEASGGIDLANVRSYAETGVQRISSGALTHSVAGSDVALEIDAGAEPQ